MKIFSTTVFAGFVTVLTLFTASSCDDGKTYAELLTEENQYVNNFLADQTVINSIPEDSVFISGPDAPYYRLDEDGQMYMQVLKPGTKDNKVKDDEQIYFRYTRYALKYYSNGELPTGVGNNTSLGSAWFRYNNFQLVSSYQWGSGIQTPLKFLPIDCEVNIVIKSQYGPVQENADVQPYLYRLTYMRPEL